MKKIKVIFYGVGVLNSNAAVIRTLIDEEGADPNFQGELSAVEHRTMIAPIASRQQSHDD